MHLTTTHRLDAAMTPVRSVTIFQSDCAEVVRKFTIALKTGENIVEISHLPHTMQTESLRVAGIGQAMLSDVVCITPKTKNSRARDAGKSEELLKLEEEKALLLGQKRVIDYQASVLVSYAHSMTSEHVSPEDMLSFLQRFTEMGEQSAKADVAFQKSLREIEKKIEKEIDDPAAEHDSSHLRNIKVKLTINAEEGHAAEISLTYLVKKASWKPIFDLRAVTGADGKPTTKLALHYRATVNQSTGEDWTEAVLNLSTASPDSFGSQIPSLMCMKIVPKPWVQGAQAPKTLFPVANVFANATNVNNTGGLFGPAPQLQQQPAAPVGVFSQQRPAAPSLFGPLFGTQSQLPVQQPAATGFSFGAAPSSTPATGGLFGAAVPNPPLAPSTSTSAFGVFGQAASNPPNPPPAPSTSAFGGFGQASANQPQATSAFGATGANAANVPAAEDYVQVSSTDEDAENPEALPEMEIPSAVTKENSMAANFEVKGNANIRSDGSSHKVAIAVLNFDAKIQTVVVPRSVPGANLHCTIYNSSKDTHLLPGSMAVYLDDGYITNTAVPHVSPGDSFKCSLGRDHSVGVTFDQKFKLLATPTSLFSANRETILYTVRVTLKNKRESQIKGLIVRDILPVSDGEPIKVVLTKPVGLAEAEEGKEVQVEDGVAVKWCESKGEKGGMKEGQLQWIVDLDKRGTKVLVLEWEVISPPGRHWAYELYSTARV